MRTRRAWVSAMSRLLVPLMAITLTRTAAAACTTNADCKGDRVCSNGECQAPRRRNAEPKTETAHPTSRQTTTTNADGATSTNVEFDGKPGLVRVEDAHCEMPCSLLLTSGAHDVVYDSQVYKLTVPAQRSTAKARLGYQLDSTDVVGGAIVTGIGVTAITLVLILATGVTDGTDDYGYPTGLASLQPGVVWGFCGIGLAIAAVGGVWLAMGLTHSGRRFNLESTRAGHHTLRPLIGRHGFGIAF